MQKYQCELHTELVRAFSARVSPCLSLTGKACVSQTLRTVVDTKKKSLVFGVVSGTCASSPGFIIVSLPGPTTRPHQAVHWAGPGTQVAVHAPTCSEKSNGAAISALRYGFY